LEGDMGYGRGWVSVLVDGVAYSRRIEASSSALMNEALGNVSTLLAVIAVVAAPFTEGASLILLIPAGVIGAMPSVYRLAERAEAHNLRWDMDTAMDIVNIVGAAVGIGAETAAAGRVVWFGRALMVTG